MASAHVPGLGIGARVRVKGTEGTVKYLGNTEFATGKWVGVELDTPEGKNSGAVQGRTYFECRPNHGLFVRQSQLTVLVPAPEGAATDSGLIRSPVPALSPVISRAPSPAASPAPVLPSTPLHASAVTPVAAGGSDEVARLRAQIEVLQTQRRDDAQRLRELDKLRVLVEQHAEYKAKWLASQKQLSEQVRDLERQAREANEKADTADAQIAEALETAEMATLDKEMAEEQLELLRSENETLKNQVESLQLDLEILQAESAEGQHGEAAESVVKVKQLEAQLERHRDALMKLRDLAAAEKQELTAKVKAMEKELATLRDVQGKNEKLTQEIRKRESEVDELKQALDDAIGATDLAERLTDKNLDLEERIRELEETVADLEALKEMSEEVDAQHALLARQLTTQLDFARADVAELTRQVALAEEEMAEYEQVVQRQRATIAHLQEGLRSGQASVTATPQSSVTSGAAPQPITSSKAHARALDAELRTLELRQSRTHVNLLQRCMPQGFVKGEQDGILLVLLLDRLVHKADLIGSHVRQLFSLDHAADATGGGQDLQRFGAGLVAALQEFKSSVQGLQERLSRSDVNAYQSLARCLGEIAVCEQPVNALISLLRSQNLGSSVSTTDLTKATQLIGRLTAAHFGNFAISTLSRIHQSLGEDVAIAELAAASAQTAGNLIVDGASLVTPLESALRAHVISLSKEVRRLPPAVGGEDGSDLEGAWTEVEVDGSAVAQLNTLTASATTMARAVNDWLTALQEHVAQQDSSVAQLVDAQTAAHLLADCTAHMGLRQGGASELDAITQGMTQTTAALRELLEATLHAPDVFETFPPPTPHPALLRAKAVQDEYADAAGLREIVDIKEEELLDLATQLKLQGVQVDDERTKNAVLAAKIAALEAEAGNTAELERRVVKLQESETRAKEALEALQEELAHLDRENSNLKRQLRARRTGAGSNPDGMASPALSGLLSPGNELAFDPSTPVASPQLSARGRTLPSAQGAAALQGAVQALRAENAALRRELSHASLADLGPLPVVDQVAAGKINSLAANSLALVKSVQTLEASAQVVRLHGGKLPVAAQLAAQREKLRELTKKSADLRQKSAAILGSIAPGGRASSDFATFLSPAFTKVVETEQRIGRMTLPSSSCGASGGAASRAHAVNLRHADFAALHSAFAY